MNAVANESKTNTVSWQHNFVWLIKRELWESRSLYIAPLIFSGVLILGVLYAMLVAGHGQVGHMKIDGAPQHIPSGPNMLVYLFFTAPFAFVAAVVTLFYTLDALYGDRRDRSFLFWKSLPISDMETVAAKLTVASLIAPVITVVVSLVTQIIVFLIVSIWVAAHGYSFFLIWTEIPVFDNLVVLIYAIIVQALWFLPVWAWCLLASAWARRAPLLWATAPIGAVWLLEYQALGTNHVGHLLLTRLLGAIPLATSIPKGLFNDHAQAPETVLHLTDVLAPGTFFSSPQVWVGVAVAVALIVAAVWVRRYREEA